MKPGTLTDSNTDEKDCSPMRDKTDLTAMGAFSPLANTWRFKSKLAGCVARLAFLGFLSGLGFVPGWHRLLGFSGFFGFFGLAILIEAVARLRRRGNEPNG